MLLAFDVGNTNIVIGIFDGKKIIEKFRIFTDISKTSDEYWVLISQFLRHAEINPKQISGIVISCVVSSVLGKLEEMSLQRFNITPLVISAGMDIGIRILYDDPAKLGVDRIANVVGGYTEHGSPLIIVDLGTATTFDVISKDGDFIGGAIAPGIGTCLNALSERARALPRIDMKIPQKAIGKDTISNLHSGCYFGFLGQIEEIIRRIKLELPEKPKVVATGGWAEAIAAGSNLIDFVDPDLTLKGLHAIFDRISNIATKGL